jgi:hypothetical protein
LREARNEELKQGCLGVSHAIACARASPYLTLFLYIGGEPQFLG